MPYNPPIPESKLRRKAADGSADDTKSWFFGAKGILGAWIQAEKLMQIALVLPCAAFIGWLIGAGLDRWLRQSWIALVGIVFGGASGLVYVVRLAMHSERDPAMQDEDNTAQNEENNIDGKGRRGAGS